MDSSAISFTTSSSTTSSSTTPYTTTCTSIFKDLESSLMTLIIGHPCTSTTCNTCTQSSIETAFTEVIKLDYGTSISVQRIKNYEAEIPQYKKIIKYAEAEIVRHNKLIEQDKINRSIAMEKMISEASKFNGEHPNDQLDLSLDFSILYMQYQFLKEKLAIPTVPSETVESTIPTISTVFAVPTVPVDLSELARSTSCSTC